jgi:hypothetical protein
MVHFISELPLCLLATVRQMILDAYGTNEGEVDVRALLNDAGRDQRYYFFLLSYYYVHQRRT